MHFPMERLWGRIRYIRRSKVRDVLFIFLMVIGVVLVAFIAKELKKRPEEKETTTATREPRISFHPHAVARMEERGIDPDRISDLLKGEFIEAKPGYNNRIRITDGELTAVFEKRLDYIEVITVYWNHENHP